MTASIPPTVPKTVAQPSLSADQRKRIFADLDGALADRFGAEIPAKVRQQAADWAAVRTRLKHLREEKQLRAKAFGTARAEGADLEPLKVAMQAVSSELKATEEHQRELEAGLALHWLPQSEAPVATAAGTVEVGSDGAPALPPRLTEAAPECSAPATWTISPYRADDRDDWDRYVDQHPRATAYHYCVWRELIEARMGQRDCSLMARADDGRVVGVLPLVRLTSRLFGDFAVSMPYFNYGGPLGDHAALERGLLAKAADRAQELGLQHLEIRSLATSSDWPGRSHKLSMIRQLPASVEMLDRQLGSKLRAQIRRAEREATEVCVGREELLDDFYRVFARNMRDLGTPVYSRGFFAGALAAWPESRLICVHLDGKPVGCAFVLGYRETLEIPWASTLREHNALGINMLMYWRVLNWAIEQGYDYFDFGRSSPDSGTYRFKKQWGAEPLPHHWRYWLPAGEQLPELNPDNPKYRLMISVWQRLPVAVTKLLGPPIVRNLP